MPDLPTGTVTFLFTDIEGSTRLLESLGPRYADVLADHHRLLRAAFARFGGHEVATQGDAFFVTFDRARDALMAAVEAQHLLQAHPWPDGARVRVRMGLHTGEPVAAVENYVGLDVHRAARIAAVAHGGQVLVSEATDALVKEDLPPAVSLRDLGRHRLKDLSTPQRLFQVVIQGLDAEFPPLRTLDARPHNLPLQLTTFIGRDREIAEVRNALTRARLVTLVGPGGSGKTRLGLQVAASLLDDYQDGVWFADLGALTEPTLVPQTVASSLGIREPGRTATEAVLEWLRPRTALLALDNCEHLRDACAALADAGLRACPNLRIVATSQAPLGVAGELTYPVPPLSSPDPHAPMSAGRLFEYEAVRLFVERAALHRAGFTVTAENARAIASICHRVDGIPLAVELAAARITVLSVQQIAGRLDDRFRLLTGGSRTGVPRHQTLRAAVDWSHDLLSREEQALLRRLSVFAGGCALEAVETVCAGDPVDRDAVLDLLSSLAEKSLVLATQQHAAARYHQLETIREYSRERLTEAGEAVECRSRHQAWCLRLAEEADLALQGPQQETWLARLETEHDNLRAALEWGRAGGPHGELALRLAGSLWRFWQLRGFWREGLEWLEDLFARVPDAPTSLRAKALTGIGYLAFRQGDFARTISAVEESLRVSRAGGDVREEALSLALLGIQACARRDYARAEVLGNQTLTLCRRVGDRWGVAYALHVLALVARDQGDVQRAKAFMEESLVITQEIGDRWAMAFTLSDLGLIVRDEKDYPRAAALTEQALAIFRGLGIRPEIPANLSNLGILAWLQGRYAEAERLFSESLAMRKELGDKPGIAVCLVGLATLALSTGQPERAARLFGAAEALRELIGAGLPPFIRNEYDAHVSAARAALGEEPFSRAWSEGRRMDPGEAVAFALGEPVGRA